MKKYNHKSIEKKWQLVWDKKKFFVARDFDRRKKHYILFEFPYLSGSGLHVGHLRPYVGTDVLARWKRMLGFNVLFPIGWDAFGLPTENYAIKNKIHPRVATDRNVKTFRRQVRESGLSFDWTREFDTADPKYYRWTQWIFLQLYKKGLAHRIETPINWCPFEKTGLANEEVVNGRHERCGTLVEKKLMKQWVIKITKYADRLIEDLAKVDYPERVKIQQVNWIGRSEGAEILFPFAKSGVKRFVLLHGRSGSPQANFFPWLRQKLVTQGYEVHVPKLPNPDRPDDRVQAEFVRANCPLDEQTVIFGHSFGGIVALRLLEQGVKLHSAVFAATPTSGKFKDTKSRPTVVNAIQRGFDFSAIRRNAGRFVVLSDSTDDTMLQSDGEYLAGKLQAEYRVIEGAAPHFCWMEEPAILEAVSPSIKVFTTRPDTIFGATYLVVAPEHSLIENFKGRISNYKEVSAYVETAKKKTDIVRDSEEKEKTGIELQGLKVKHPITGRELPVWVADYVMMGYGAGAIMAVPAHDERDFAFAKKYNLPIKQVIAPETGIKRGGEQRRDGGCAVVFDPLKQRYAVSQRKNGMFGLFAGGVESGEDEKLGILREVEEESGLYDFKQTEKIGSTLSHFHNSLKNVDRVASASCYLVILNSASAKPQKLESHEDFVLAWVTAGEILENWSKFNSDQSLDHWVWFLKQSVGRANELGFDKESDKNKFQSSAYTGEGVLISSAEFNGSSSQEAKKKIASDLESKGLGRKSISYKLRDWIFSRQHYWGEPIPIIHCFVCGEVPVPENELPVLLPNVKNYEPTETGESPLASIDKFVNVKCPNCDGPAKRETDTMPNWAGSNWYFIRYTDSHNRKEFSDRKKLRYWMPVDLYIGGMEHTTLHLLYSRFIYKFLYDQRLVPGPEPYAKRRSNGVILAEDGRKMSKSYGNVINPDDIIAEYGADTMRMYEMFLAPFEQMVPWDSRGVIGVRRFLDRLWRLVQTSKVESRKSKWASVEEKRLVHRLVRKITTDLEEMKFNTAVSAFMDTLNKLEALENISKSSLETLLKVLNPFAPHIAEELWAVLGHKKSIQLEAWPEYDATLLVSDTVKVPVQVNGKMRDLLEVSQSASQEQVESLARSSSKVEAHLHGKIVVRTIYVPGKMLNFVVK